MPEEEKIAVHSDMVDVLNRVSPEMLKQTKDRDVSISKEMHYVNVARNPHFFKFIGSSQDVCAGVSTYLMSWFSSRGTSQSL